MGPARGRFRLKKRIKVFASGIVESERSPEANDGATNV